MREVVSVESGALGELRERLLRWDELCAQLKELYYKYLDLAAFRSEKCYFPGRRCKRSWKREYDLGDLTLMWTYIANTVPLCDEFAKMLLSVEYALREKALRNLENGYVKKRATSKDGKVNVVHLHLRNPIGVYFVLWRDRPYIVWKEFDGLTENMRLRGFEIENGIAELIEQFEQGGKVDAPVIALSTCNACKRFHLSVRFNGLKMPIALFRNLGWLLSDDDRYEVIHETGTVGQATLRLLDWLSLVTYVTRIEKITKPIVFKLHVRHITESTGHPNIKIYSLGTATEIIKRMYEQIGITLGKPDSTISRGLEIIKSLANNAFRREGNVYVVDDVNSWIAFSNAVNTLILGDGSVLPFHVEISLKSAPRMTLEEKTSMSEKLAEALHGTATTKGAILYGWRLRLLLPSPPLPLFEKSVKLYRLIVDYPSLAIVKVDNNVYVLNHIDLGNFSISKKKGEALYNLLKQRGLKVRVKGNVIVVQYAQLKELAPILLNDLERETVRTVKPITATPNLETVVKIVPELLRLAKILEATSGGRKYLRIILYDKSKLEEVVAMLTGVGIRVSIARRDKEIRIYEKRSIEVLTKAISKVFSNSLLANLL